MKMVDQVFQNQNQFKDKIVLVTGGTRFFIITLLDYYNKINLHVTETKKKKFWTKWLNFQIQINLYVHININF